MASTFIGVNHRSGAPQLKSYTNATPLALGNAINGGVGDQVGGAGVPANYFMNTAPFVYFLGNFYTVIAAQIWRSTDFGSTWTSVHSINPPGVTQTAHSGLHVLFANGTPLLAIISCDTSANNKYCAWSTDGLSWTDTPSVADPTGTNTVVFISPVLFHGKLFVTSARDNNVAALWGFDPGSKALTVTNFGSNGGFGCQGSLCVCQDRLFYLQMVLGSNNYNLYEIQGSTFVLRYTDSAAAGYSGDYKDLLFTDGTFLYMLFLYPGSGWQLRKITLDTWAAVNLNSILPAIMGAAAPNTGRVGMLTDGVAQPGSTPGRYIYYATSGGTATPWTMLQWNGPASAMTIVDSGGLASDAMPFFTQVDGDVFFATGQKKVEITARTAVSGGVRYSFKLWGGGTVSVRAFFCGAAGEFPNQAATLANPSAGSLVGNQINGLAADDGVTAYQVTWLAATDGLASGSFPKFLLEQL